MAQVTRGGDANPGFDPALSPTSYPLHAREALRLGGSATLAAEPALLENCAARGKPAVLVTRVSIETCFFHCGKALIRSNLWQPETWDAPSRVSFGRMLAKANGGDDHLADTIDQNIADDYTNNL